MKMNAGKARPKDIDEYIDVAPKATQKKLLEMRACIRKAAPGAKEFPGAALPLGPMSFTYDDVGATRESGFCPPGFHPLHVRTRIGEGEKVFRRATEAVLTWEMHREMGVGIDASAGGGQPVLAASWIDVAPFEVGR